MKEKRKKKKTFGKGKSNVKILSVPEHEASFFQPASLACFTVSG